MSFRYFFDVHNGQNLTKDEDGVICHAPEEISSKAVDTLPDIVVRDELHDGPSTLSVKARDESGQCVFRATLTLASAWTVETVCGQQQPGGDRWTPALARAKAQVTALRREFAEGGLSEQLEGLDSLFSVAVAEMDRLMMIRRARL